MRNVRSAGPYLNRFLTWTQHDGSGQYFNSSACDGARSKLQLQSDLECKPRLFCDNKRLRKVPAVYAGGSCSCRASLSQCSGDSRLKVCWTWAHCEARGQHLGEVQFLPRTAPIKTAAYAVHSLSQLFFIFLPSKHAVLPATSLNYMRYTGQGLMWQWLCYQVPGARSSCR